MRFKLDENLPAALAADLAQIGHDAATCLAEGIAGSKDATIATHAASEDRILITSIWTSQTFETIHPERIPELLSCESTVRIFRAVVLHSQGY